MQGKRTVLVAQTLDRADEEQRAKFEAGFGKIRANADMVATMSGIVEATGARAHVEQQIDELTAVARAAAADPLLDAKSSAVLDSLVTAATRRKY